MLPQRAFFASCGIIMSCERSHGCVRSQRDGLAGKRCRRDAGLSRPGWGGQLTCGWCATSYPHDENTMSQGNEVQLPIATSHANKVRRIAHLSDVHMLGAQ